MESELGDCIACQYPARVFDRSRRGGPVAIVTDGSAVLGLGNIGAWAAICTGQARHKIDPEKVAAITKEYLYEGRLLSLK